MAAEELPPRVKTLERGSIYFFYRPLRAGRPEQDAQVHKLHMVLKPQSQELYRLSIISTRKRPDPEAGRRFWGFVDMVRTSPKSLREELAADSYKAKVRGEDQLRTACPVGEGAYRIIRHGDHTHLLYALELTEHQHEIPATAGFEPEANFILSIKNPEKKKTGPSLTEAQPARFPTHLQEKFHGRRFAEADPAGFLDREGAEFQLSAAAPELTRELGIQLDLEAEFTDSVSIFQDLRLDRSEHAARPLFEGKWER